MAAIADSERIKTTTKDETPCIYALFNNNNQRIYIGQSKKPMIRFASHKNALKAGTHQSKELQEDYNKGHSFTFYKIWDYFEDDTETMRYRELSAMDLCRKKGYLLYNSETDSRIKNLLKFDSQAWKLHCEMERKRDEYYKKYFGCTYYQFCAWDMMDRQKGKNNYMKYKMEWFVRAREKEIEEEKKKIEMEKRRETRKLLSGSKKISFYIKKDTYKILTSITNEPEKYINNLIEAALKKEVLKCQ